MRKFLDKMWRQVVSNPTVILGVIVAAVNTTPVGDQSWQGYASAIGIALVRYFTEPYYDFRKP